MRDVSTESADGLCFDRGGSGAALLVCLHGLGANGRVWQPFLAEAPGRWRWLAPDLPGHGLSAKAEDYTVADYAAALAGWIGREAAGAPVTLLGHSLGGVIALELARPDHGLAPAAVFAVGIKVSWHDDELEQMRKLSEREAKRFESASDALGFYGRQSGLGDVAPGSALARRAIIEEDGSWRTAVDTRAYAVTRPDMGGLVAATSCPVHLACGTSDPMVSIQQLLAFDQNASEIAAAGHNAMVDAPSRVWDWLGGRR